MQIDKENHFLLGIKRILNKFCFFRPQNLWACLIVGIVFAVPGFILGAVFGIQLGAPLAAQFGSRTGYFLLPLIILILLVSLFFIIGMNVGNILAWLFLSLLHLFERKGS
jgi:hypothetical protein